MKRKLISLFVLSLSGSPLLAFDNFTPSNTHFNIFHKHRANAPYLIEKTPDFPTLSPFQQQAMLDFATAHLGLPNWTPRLLLPPPAKINLLPKPNATGIDASGRSPVKAYWKHNALYIVVTPNQLDYDSLLQLSLSTLETANQGRMPVINGRDLKAVLAARDGHAVPVYQRSTH